MKLYYVIALVKPFAKVHGPYTFETAKHEAQQISDKNNCETKLVEQLSTYLPHQTTLDQFGLKT